MFIHQPLTTDALNAVIPQFSVLAKHGVLVTAGSGIEQGQWNTMTASWALAGYLWNRPCAVLFIRPQRYTADFAEQEDYLSVSFFDIQNEKLQKALHICGTLSGRDENKAKKAGLTPLLHDEGIVGFAEAALTVSCRKLYCSQFDMDLFLDPQVVVDCYPKKDFHCAYFCELQDMYRKS